MNDKNITHIQVDVEDRDALKKKSKEIKASMGAIIKALVKNYLDKIELR